jgi:MerR family transcriptional regulator, thiopeptide resistance regulator
VSWTVGEVARIGRVTVRTLHHYDQIGLLCPSERSAAGYRRYDQSDLVRLQQIRAYRELGFGLEEIAKILDDADADPLTHLRRQHAVLTEELGHLRDLLATVEKTMEAFAMGIRLNPEEMFEVFGEHDPTEHAAEARERWGETDAYKESARRTSTYTKDDWLAIQAEGQAVNDRFVAAMRAGRPADSDEARAAAEAHRAQISRWFYDCGYDIHRGLAQMYVADPRFRATYEQIAPGLATYVHDAIVANADRADAG